MLFKLNDRIDYESFLSSNLEKMRDGLDIRKVLDDSRRIVNQVSKAYCVNSKFVVEENVPQILIADTQRI